MKISKEERTLLTKILCSSDHGVVMGIKHVISPIMKSLETIDLPLYKSRLIEVLNGVLKDDPVTFAEVSGEGAQIQNSYQTRGVTT